MRTRSPCLRTLPSIRLATPSFSPIAAGSLDFPLKKKDELRPITFSSGILARTAINSSERPSEKYSLLGSPLVLTSGSTAIDLAVAADLDALGIESLCDDIDWRRGASTNLSTQK